MFGFVNPILTRSDGRIIAGHARVPAALEAGLTEVPVIVLDHLSEAECRKLVIADNKLAENSSWNEERLALEVAAIRAAAHQISDVLGFTEDEELAELLAAVDADALTEERTRSRKSQRFLRDLSSPADLWIARDHRLR